MAIARQHLLIFGPGYTASAIGKAALAAGFRVSASWRRLGADDDLRALGFTPVAIEAVDVSDVTHIIHGIAPRSGDPVFPIYRDAIQSAPALTWMGYLSSTNVYGDHQGGWVDENTHPAPHLMRGKRRLAAERDWQQVMERRRTPLHIFRLAGIYGPGRSAFDSLRAGTARRIIKEGQLFSRIHLADIVSAVMAAMISDLDSQIFNMADQEPAPPQDVISFAAELLGVTPPPAQSLDTAEMSDFARSFYSESKRVRADKLQTLLGVRLRYPTYRDGLRAILAAET